MPGLRLQTTIGMGDIRWCFVDRTICVEQQNVVIIMRRCTKICILLIGLQLHTRLAAGSNRESVLNLYTKYIHLRLIISRHLKLLRLELLTVIKSILLLDANEMASWDFEHVGEDTVITLASKPLQRGTTPVNC